MKRVRVLLALTPVLLLQSAAFGWHDTAHMVTAQIAYLRLSPAARAEVDRLLLPAPDRRPLIHLCAGYYRAATCEKTYDPITIAVWMDDFRGDSLNDAYDTWHYVNFRPFFDGIPERSDTGPLPTNLLDRLIWCINTLRTRPGSDKRSAEALGFIYHLVGDAHQPLHAITRYSAAHPDGDAGGNGFKVKMPGDVAIGNLHAYWDAAAGLFGWQSPQRPLGEADRTRIRRLADDLARKYPAEAMPECGDKDPNAWILEGNTIARRFCYAKIGEGEEPSRAYAEEARTIAGRRIALAGYRLASVLNDILANKEEPWR